MLATKQPVLRRFWYPVMPSTRLGDDAPHSFTLLGEDIVLWRGGDGAIACFRDRCCHRTARLSLGFIENGRLVCGYHGWTYRSDGVCVRIPQRENPDNVSDQVRVPAYRAAERYGHVWVALAEPLTDIPAFPEAAEPGFRQVDQFYEPWNIGAFRLMENSFDAAHIAFVHRKTFGNMERPRTDGHRDIRPTQYGFDTVNESPVKVRGEVAHRAVHTNSGETVRRSQSTWYMPFARRLSIHYPHGLIHSIITCATPMTDQLFEERRQINVQASVLIGAQDRHVDTLVQRGLRSRHAIRGRYSWQERTHREFNKWLVDRYRASWQDMTGVKLRPAAE